MINIPAKKFLQNKICLEFTNGQTHHDIARYVPVLFIFSSYLKVSKFEKHFFLKLHCPKTERNISQNSALVLYSRILSNISFVFWAMEFQEKMLLIFTDLYNTFNMKSFLNEHF